MAPHIFDDIFPGQARVGHHEHPNITREILGQIPEAMTDPIAIFKSESQKGDLIFMLDLKDAQGRTVILPMALNAITENDVRGNIGKTVYARGRETLYAGYKNCRRGVQGKAAKI